MKFSAFHSQLSFARAIPFMHLLIQLCFMLCQNFFICSLEIFSSLSCFARTGHGCQEGEIRSPEKVRYLVFYVRPFLVHFVRKSVRLRHIMTVWQQKKISILFKYIIIFRSKRMKHINGCGSLIQEIFYFFHFANVLTDFKFFKNVFDTLINN